jgi:nucleoside phosphorylase
MASQDDKPKEIKEALVNECYTVGWICAVKTEYVAAQLFLDEKHGRPHQQSQHDGNDYTLGQIGKHNVVIATLPGGEYGTSAATGVAKDMLHSFPNVRIGLMVGIAGGAPNKDHDIRLGDIVVSMPDKGESGVIYYDFGKAIQNQGLELTGHLDKTPTILRTAVTGLHAEHDIEPHTIEDAVRSKLRNARLRKNYGRPDPITDKLYQSTFEHHEKCCAEATGDETAQLVHRDPRDEDEDSLVIHYGLIASGNKLMKNALVRDRISAEHGILCFEMEAAGLMNNFRCLVIRGICDYSDTHKNKSWQGFAAMAAAAYARDLLHRIPPAMVQYERKLGEIIGDGE